MTGEPFVPERPTMPASAILLVQKRAVPLWLEFLTPIQATPTSRALATASSTARCEATWPQPLCASMTAVPGVSATTSRRVSGSISPFFRRPR